MPGRKQRTIVNENHSQWAVVTSGVPQWSVLGPILFLLYINSMSNGVTSKMFYFADDAKIYRAITNLAEQEELQKDLYKLKKWSNGGDLEFNQTKCHQLTLSLKTSSNRTYSLDGTTPLTRVYLVQSHCLNFLLPLIPSFRIVVQLPDSSRSSFSSSSRPTPPFSLPKICPIRTFGSSGFSSLDCSTISIRQGSSRHTPSAPNWPTTAGKLSGLLIFERK